MIGHRDCAPSFLRDNDFLLNGYRINHSSCRSASRSLFTCHNETVNVWTHLAGAIVMFMILVISFVPSHSADLDRQFEVFDVDVMTFLEMKLQNAHKSQDF